MEPSELVELYRGADHWRYHRLGDLWFKAAQALGPGQPSDSRRACQWSYYYFDLYSAEWTAHLPASRWDSDGGAEIMDVRKFENSLAAGGLESTLPAWSSLLLAGDWQKALAEFGDGAIAAEFQPLAAVLADACKMAGRESEASQVLAKVA